MIIDKKSLAQEVSNKLIELIDTGYYKLNDKLPIESELMAIHGVGRSTVREAVKILSNMGLLSVKQGKGTFVESLTSREDSIKSRLQRTTNEELYELRQALELKTIQKAAVNRTENNIKNIVFFLEKRKHAIISRNWQVCKEAEGEFYIEIAEACGNEFLRDLYKLTIEELDQRFVFTDACIEKFISNNPLYEKLGQFIIEKKADEASILLVNCSGVLKT